MISEPLDFAPTAAMLSAALDELEDLGGASGGAVDASSRRAALAAYGAMRLQPEVVPSGWRHEYVAMPFEGLQWSSGRLRVANTAGSGPARRVAEEDAPALAVDNAGGIVHASSILLEPSDRIGDPRITLFSLADARRRMPSRVAAIHGTIVAPFVDRFTALSTAFQNCGAFVAVPTGLHLDLPIQIVWSGRPGAPSAVFPHTVIEIARNAHAVVIERFIGGTDSFVAGIVEIDIAQGASLDYVSIQQAHDGVRLFMRRAARCAAGARIGWHCAELGSALTRSIMDVPLAGDGAGAVANVLSFARMFANVDLAMRVDHLAPETTSRTIVRAAATERASGRFSATVHIGPNAPRSDVTLREDALVLSRTASFEAQPAFEIESNDVSATHAVTVGTLDEEMLFYAQTRGITRAIAERMIALAFFEPAITGFPSESLRDEVRTLLDERLDEIPATFLT